MLEVDASGYAVGAVLLQCKKDSKLHPIGYFSSTLNEVERNYDIYNLELLAIIKALEHWRPYLAGSPHKIKVFLDHMNLQYWCQPHKISRWVAREVLTLSKYNIKIHHFKGKANGRADTLSRHPDYNHGDQDNQDVMVLLDKIFVRAITESIIDNAGSLSTSISPKEIMIEHPVYEQDKDILRPWIKPHGLKELQGTWYKDG